jgi:hypothetical protein
VVSGRRYMGEGRIPWANNRIRHECSLDAWRMPRRAVREPGLTAREDNRYLFR